MKIHFDQELCELKNELIKMSALVEDAIFNSIKALKEQNKILAFQLIKNDQEIDALELVIEERCIELLALRQPTATDLRFITTGIKLNAELERIADLAVDISERVIELTNKNKPIIKPLIDIPKLCTIAQEMVKESIDSFVNQDIELATKVVLSDTLADNLRNLIQEELVNNYLIKDGSTAPQVIPLLLIARHLERICDHATNIAEDIIYMIQTKVVKHHPERLVTDR